MTNKNDTMKTYYGNYNIYNNKIMTNSQKGIEKINKYKFFINNHIKYDLIEKISFDNNKNIYIY